MDAHDVRRELKIGIRRRELRGTNFHALGISALPPFEEITSVWIVRIDSKSKWTCFQVGICGLDFKALRGVYALGRQFDGEDSTLNNENKSPKADQKMLLASDVFRTSSAVIGPTTGPRKT